MSLARQYLQTALELQQRVADANAGVIRELGGLIAGNLARGGVLHLFGSGHSRIVAMEMERRAGGLAPISTIEDPTPGWAEQLPGFGQKLFQRYCFEYQPQPGEFIIVVSNSGKNASPLEVAAAAREHGLRLVALTSLAMSKEAQSLHPSRLRLFEMAEFVLDNGGLPGDAAIPVPGQGDLKVGPTSTLTGAILLNLLHLEIIDQLFQANGQAPIIRSQNLSGGAEHNEKLALKYRQRIRRPI